MTDNYLSNLLDVIVLTNATLVLSHSNDTVHFEEAIFEGVLTGIHFHYLHGRGLTAVDLPRESLEEGGLDIVSFGRTIELVDRDIELGRHSWIGSTGEFDDVVVKKGSCEADGRLESQKSVRTSR